MPGGAGAVEPLGEPAVAARRTPDPVQLGGQPGVALGDLVVGTGQLEQHPVAGLGQPAAELAVAHVLQRRQQPAYRDLVDTVATMARSDLDDERDDHRPAAVGVAHPPADGAADDLLELAGVGDAFGRGLLERLLDAGRTSSKTLSSSANPRAWISGPPTTLPVTESTTTKTEMKPSSPRIRRSFSDDSVTSPTASPST